MSRHNRNKLNSDIHIIIKPASRRANDREKIMKKIIRESTIIFVIMIAFISYVQRVAAADKHELGMIQQKNYPLAAPTLIPTVSPSIVMDETTPTPRVLPDVGGNAVLVIGASVLVLIIIGGVLSARLRQKH